MSEANTSSTGSVWRWLIIGGVIIAIVLLLWWLWPTAAEKPQQQRGGRPAFGAFGGPTPVRVAAVEQGRFEVYAKALGTVTPLNTVNVRSRVAENCRSTLRRRPAGAGWRLARRDRSAPLRGRAAAGRGHAAAESRAVAERAGRSEALSGIVCR